jgi:DNA-binding MarR family transcriptional regulator
MTGAGPGVPADKAGFLLSRVGTAVQAGFKDVLARWDIRPLHFLVLNALIALGGPSQQALCQALGIDSGNMVELLDKLEDLGYAKRAPDADDRRRHVVTITQRGRSALSQISREVAKHDGRMLAPLDEGERRRLVELLAKLYAATPEGKGRGYAVAGPEAPERS